MLTQENASEADGTWSQRRKDEKQKNKNKNITPLSPENVVRVLSVICNDV